MFLLLRGWSLVDENILCGGVGGIVIDTRVLILKRWARGCWIRRIIRIRRGLAWRVMIVCGKARIETSSIRIVIIGVVVVVVAVAVAGIIIAIAVRVVVIVVVAVVGTIGVSTGRIIIIAVIVRWIKRLLIEDDSKKGIERCLERLLRRTLGSSEYSDQWLQTPDKYFPDP